MWNEKTLSDVKREEHSETVFQIKKAATIIFVLNLITAITVLIVSFVQFGFAAETESVDLIISGLTWLLVAIIAFCLLLPIKHMILGYAQLIEDSFYRTYQNSAVQICSKCGGALEKSEQICPKCAEKKE